MMSEGKPQSLSLPVRVRFRQPVEQPATDEDYAMEEAVAASPKLSSDEDYAIEEAVAASPKLSSDDEPTAPSLPVVKHTTQQQNRQIKELIRLGNILRADLNFDEVLEQIISSINACLGFRSSVLNLIEDGYEYLKAVAFAGTSEEDRQTLLTHPVRVGQMLRMMK